MRLVAGFLIMADAAKAAGNKEFQAQNYAQAIEHFSKAIELGGEAHVLYSNRSACHCGLKQYDEALADASKCIEAKPAWGKVCRSRGCPLPRCCIV